MEPDDLHAKGRRRRREGGVSEGHRAALRLDKRASGGHLTATERHALPARDFALPGERYPVEDKAHARAALSRVSANGSSEEKAKVRNKVHRKYPDMGEKDE